MSEAVLREIRDLIQQDINHRGLATDPEANLIKACPDDFADACRSIAETPRPTLFVVTGFYIAHADPPCGETDGPLGRCSWRVRWRRWASGSCWRQNRSVRNGLEGQR